MDSHPLKRRRPYGHEEPPSEPSQFQPILHDSDFTSLSPEHQRFLNQAASIYGLDGSYLHHLVQSDHSNKRQRLTQDYSMAPYQYRPDGFAPGDDPEKASYEDQGHVGGCGDPSSSAFPSTSLQQVASGLANLRFAICPTCFTRVSNHEPEYHALPGPGACEYGIDKPYEAEKRPSIQGRGAEEYVPSSSAYSTGSALHAEFIPPYQDLSEISPISPNNTKQDVSYFATSAPVPAPFAIQTLDSLPVPIMSHDGGFPHSYSIASAAPLIPYNTNVLSVESSSHITTPLVATHPSHYPLKDYGTSGTEVPLDKQDLPESKSDMIVVPPNQKPPATKRGPFASQELRELTAQTRRIGSCIRCRMQRIRCHVNPEDTEGPCLTCNKSKQKPNPKIWKLPCLRAKITDVKLFKPGQVRGKEWTQRWKDSIVDNITTWVDTEQSIIDNATAWVDTEKRILVTEGYTPQCGIALRVKRFKPQSGDNLRREWASTDNSGRMHYVELPAYAIVDLQEAENQYKDYITNCIGSFDSFGTFVSAVLDSRPRPHPSQDHRTLRETYALAWEMSHAPDLTQKERDLLTQVLRLWVAIRLTTASTTIIGTETLGIKKMPPDSPQRGQRPVPPVMGAQIDTILRVNLQAKWRREILELLQKMTQENKQSTWMTTYLVTFILLHNIALITEHDANYATKHHLKRRWAREEQVKEYVFGANILLAYFHYCNKGVFPFSEVCRDQDLRGLAELNESKFGFVQRTRQWAIHQKRKWEELHREEKYEDSYFWVSQLYTYNWTPQAVA